MPTATPAPTPTPTPLPPSEIAKSSVRIDVFVEEQGRSVLAGHGSGTILTADGQILTNAHVVTGADELIINLTSDVDQSPTPTYYAEPIEVDHVLDLALLQITTDLDGNEVVRSELDLPALELGNSDDIALGQRICILGYPGIGRETVTFTEGTVSGFVSEDLGDGSERIWVKTDTDISFGNSGGTAVDDRGLLVGIPTAGVGSEMETLGYLRPLRFTNRTTVSSWPMARWSPKPLIALTSTRTMSMSTTLK
jgi:S1-C subfamily serine protease